MLYLYVGKNCLMLCIVRLVLLNENSGICESRFQTRKSIKKMYPVTVSDRFSDREIKQTIFDFLII